MVETGHGRMAVETAATQSLHRQGALTGSAGPGSQVQPEASDVRGGAVERIASRQPEDTRLGGQQRADRAAQKPLEPAPHGAPDGAADEVRPQSQRSGLSARGRRAQSSPDRQRRERFDGRPGLFLRGVVAVIEQFRERGRPFARLVRFVVWCEQQQIEGPLPLRHRGDHEIGFVVDRQVLQRVDDQVD